MKKSWESTEIDFINTIKSTSMSKSYKIPLLWAFYNNGNIKLKIDEDDIYNAFNEFYKKEENAKDLENQKSTQNYKNWGKKEYIKLAKDNSQILLSYSNTIADNYHLPDKFAVLKFV